MTKPRIILRAMDKLWVPRHPITDQESGETVRWRCGKIRAGQLFRWHGDPDVLPTKAKVVESDYKPAKAVPERKKKEAVAPSFGSSSGAMPVGGSPSVD